MIHQTMRNGLAVDNVIVPNEVEAWILGDGNGSFCTIILVQSIDVRCSSFREDVEIGRKFV